MERFVRRLHLDLLGTPPAAAQQQAIAARLLAAGNSAAARQELCGELIGQPAFAANYLAELENRVLAGQPRAAAYQLLCGAIRGGTPECRGCAPNADPCADCNCRLLRQLAAERDRLAEAEADLRTQPTSAIERRYAGALLYRFFRGTPEAVVRGLFNDFLGRPPEPDELRNGSALFFGALLDPGAPAGVLFHRHGSSIEDLVEILFSSEVYREALAGRVFLRYLGRPPTPAERAHFAATLDPDRPDARPLLRAVTSSREYYIQ
jgi:hypothetical protein